MLPRPTPNVRPTMYVVGDVNVDLGMRVEALPAEGDDVQASSRAIGSGGGGLNAAVAARALGVGVSLVGRVGDDPLAEIALATAWRLGVDLSHLQIDRDQPTGTCMVVTTPSGERTLFSHRGANVALDRRLARHVPIHLAELLLVSAYALLAEPQRGATMDLIERAFAAKVPIAMDLGLAVIARARPTLLNAWPKIGMMLLNESELRALAGEHDLERALAWMQSHGTSVNALKRGARGCTLIGTDGVRFECPGGAENPVDTTACGDAFASGCSLAWARGMNLEACGRVGNALGSLTASRAGSAESIPTSEELQRSGALDHWPSRQGGEA